MQVNNIIDLEVIMTIFNAKKISTFVVILFALFITNTVNAQDAMNTKGKISYEELWHLKIDTKFEGRPTIDGDHLYVGGEDGILRKINRTTGKQVWQYDAGAAIGSSVSIDYERAYFSAWDGSVHAVFKNKGNLAWRFKTNGEKHWDAWDHRLSTPAVDNMNVYFGSGDHNIYSVHNITGALRWKVETGAIVHTEPTLYGERVVIGSYDGKLYSIDRYNGTIQWVFKTTGNRYFRNGAIGGDVLIDDGIAYFGTRDYNLYAVLMQTGTGAWNYRTPSWVNSKPVIKDDTVYISNSNTPNLMAVKKSDGRLKWQTPLKKNSYGRAVLIGDTHVAVADQDGHIYVMDTKNGEIDLTYLTPSARKNYKDFYDETGPINEFVNGSFTEYSEYHFDRLNKLGAISAGLVNDGDIIYFSNSGGDIVALKILGVAKK